MIRQFIKSNVRYILNNNFVLNLKLHRSFYSNQFSCKSIVVGKSFYKTNNIVSISHLLKNTGLKISNPTIRTFSLSQCKNLVGGRPNNTRYYSKNKSTMNYVIAVGVLAVGLSYSAVPLYRIFCQAYSYGGTVQTDTDASKVQSLVRLEDRVIKIRFNADTGAAMTWNFKPQQSLIKLAPGETALAFYSAVNPTDRAVIGVSTYNVLPFEAGQYFNKIQCFCFEEQMLNPNEEVSMPVFFYIDPEFAMDPMMEFVNEITLSYTFFEVKEGQKLPMPNFARK